MDDRYGEARLVDEALQLTFPQMNAGAVAAAAIGRDQDAIRIGIADLAEPPPPATDALDGECRRIGIDADIDPALVGGDVVDPIGRDLPQPLDFEVMDTDRLRLALAAQLSTAVLEVPTPKTLSPLAGMGEPFRRSVRCRLDVDSRKPRRSMMIRSYKSAGEPTEPPSGQLTKDRRPAPYIASLSLAS